MLPIYKLNRPVSGLFELNATPPDDNHPKSIRPFFCLSLRMVCELRGGTDEALRSSREVMV